MNLGDIYALLTAIVWAFAMICFRISSLQFHPIQLKVFQNTVALVLFFLSLFVLNQPFWPEFTGSEWTRLLISAFLGITIGDTFHIASVRRLGAGLQALVDCLYSPILIGLAFLFFHETLTWLEVLGVCLISSAIVMASVDKKSMKISRRDLIVGLTYGFFCQLVMGLCVIIVKDLLLKESVWTMTTYRFLFANIVLIVTQLLFVRGEPLSAPFRNIRSWIWTVPGAILGPYAATLLWFLGFKYTNAGRAAIFNQTSSFFIIILAALFLKERLTRLRLFAVFLAVLGGVIVTL